MARAIGHARSAVCGGQHRYPSTQSVRVRPIRIGLGWGWCAPHAHRQQRKTRGVETSHMRLKTCMSLGGCFGTLHPRRRAPSAPLPGSAGPGRGWWRLRDGKGHPDHSLLLIDVDRTGSAQSCPALALRQAQIRLPRRAADPPCMDAPRDASDFFLLDMVERSSSSVYPASLCSSVRCGPSW